MPQFMGNNFTEPFFVAGPDFAVVVGAYPDVGIASADGYGKSVINFVFV
jgi:hypothetical protein